MDRLITASQEPLAWLSRLGEFFSPNDLNLVGDYLPNILIALFLGVFIGLERTYRHKQAGVRTYSVLTVTACLVALTGYHLFEITMMGDPARLAHGVLNGVGFVGAGVILRRGITASGVTTASTILFAVGVGVACGLGLYSIAAVATALTITTVSLSYKFFPSSFYDGHTLKVMCPVEKFSEVRHLFGKGYRVDKIQKNHGKVEFHIQTTLTPEEIDLLIARQVKNEDVISIQVLWAPSD